MQARTILHLTDLHLGSAERKGHYWNSESTELQLPAHDQRGLLGSLLRDLVQQCIKPDLVIVTGDLLDRGGHEGVPMAVDFLGNLCDKLALPRRRLILVPGNHDVLRSPDPKARYTSFDAICNTFYGQNVTGFGPETPAHQRVVRFDFIADLGIEVIGFNSCEGLDPASGQEHGSIGTAQRDRAEDLLRGTDGAEKLRIAAMHHHLVSPAGVVRNDISVMDDAALTLRWLMQRRFHLVLHGHQHVDWHEPRELDGWKIAITAGASAGVAGYGRNHWSLRLGYQILVLDASCGQRIRREFDPQTREWIEATKDSANETIHFGLAAASNSAAASKPDLRDRVVELASRARWDRRALMQAYTCCAQGERRRDFDGEHGGDLASRMLRALFTMTRQVDGTLPWLMFTWHLVQLASAPGTTDELNQLTVPLSDFFDEATSSMALSGDIVDACKRRVAADRLRLQKLELHAVVVVHKRPDRHAYFVRVFRVLVPHDAETWADDDIEPLELPGGDDREVHDAGELAALVRDLFLTLDADLARAEDATVELFLPIALLGSSVDQWLVDSGFGDTRLGHEYRVVVRSWERVYQNGHGMAMQKWRPRWQRLLDANPASVWRCGSAASRGPQLPLPREHPACVVLSVVPSTDATLATIIKGGTAVAVWPRKAPAPASTLDTFLSDKLSDESLGAWRDEVRAFRKEAAIHDDPDAHPGSHLTLLWDDPNKLPPDAPGRGHPFRAPAKTRGP